MEVVLEDRIVYCPICHGEGATLFSTVFPKRQPLLEGLFNDHKYACPYCDGKGLWGIQRVEVAA